MFALDKEHSHNKRFEKITNVFVCVFFLFLPAIDTSIVCSAGNGCSDFCRVVNGTDSCYCPPGYQLNATTSTTCSGTLFFLFLFFLSFLLLLFFGFFLNVNIYGYCFVSDCQDFCVLNS